VAPKGSVRAAEAFLASCAKAQKDDVAAAAVLEKHIWQALRDSNLRPLMVAARAKSLESMRAKLLQKPYKRPRSQLTDRLGVRVILYHAREVDDVADLLRQTLTVRESHSSDKRLTLGLREFGYRSYHLVASLHDTTTSTPQLRELRGRVFEVQIRSLLEHAWAEIEHEVVYKSDANWPREIKRRFASIAGVLELLEHEFEELEGSAEHLIEQAIESLKSQPGKNLSLDVPLMCAFLELEQPDGLSFRRARADGKPFPAGIDRLMFLGLRRAGIRTLNSLRRDIRSRKVRRSVGRYAAAEGIAPREVSHLAILELILALRTPVAFRVFFPEFVGDRSMQAAIR
jgi:ppGpp synthetase/RelA/SpoT-type nucleotidyltranferase